MQDDNGPHQDGLEHIAPSQPIQASYHLTASDAMDETEEPLDSNPLSNTLDKPQTSTPNQIPTNPQPVATSLSPDSLEVSETPLKSKKPYRKVNGKLTSKARIAAIVALRQAGLTTHEIARELKTSNSMVLTVGQRAFEDSKTVELVKKNLAGQFYINTRRALDNVSDSKLDAMNAYQLTMIAAISTDKARLAEGLATSRIEYMGAEDESLAKDIQRLESELCQFKSKAIDAETV